MSFGTEYRNGLSGSLTTPGLLDEVGAYAGGWLLMGDELLLFAARFVADNVGVVQFAGNASEGISHEVLVFGENYFVPWNQVLVAGVELSVTGPNVDLPAAYATYNSPGLEHQEPAVVQQLNFGADRATDADSTDLNGERENARVRPVSALLDAGTRRLSDEVPITLLTDELLDEFYQDVSEAWDVHEKWLTPSGLVQATGDEVA